MREILFRGKRKHIVDLKDSGWVFGDLITEEFSIYTKLRILIEIIPETLGQYTGLTDKNGKKIFEGDIVALGEYRYTVEWKEDRLGYGYFETADRMLQCDGGHCEIIGNIHDNPELLGGENR